MTVAAARRRSRRDPTVAIVVGGLGAAMLAAAVVGALGGGRDAGRPATDSWVAAAEDAFAPFQQLPEVYRALDDWRAGTADPSDVAVQLTELRDAVGSVAPALADLGPYPDAPLAAPLHLAAARLYEVALDVEAVVLDLPAGEDAHQLDLLARRVEVLANRVFDRGRAAVGLGPAADLGPDVIVHRPDPVPSWTDEGLAAGPPLGAGAAATVLGPTATWLVGARAALPDVDALADVLGGGDPGALVAAADRLEQDVMALRAAPDPDGGDRATRVSLGLLLRVEAARLAAAASTSDRADDLRRGADAVVGIAAQPALWDDELGPLP